MSVESSERGSVESSGEGGTTSTGSRRARFRAWRNRRPFAGGVLLLLAGVLIAYVPLQFAFELLLVGGSYTYVGLLWAVGVFLCGAFALYRPDLSTIFGVLGVALSILSLLGALGGLLIGMIVGIIGGNLCVAWQRPDAPDRGGGGPRDDRPVRTDGGSPTDREDRPVRTDGGTPSDRSDRSDGDESPSRLGAASAVLGASPRDVSLHRVRRSVRRAVPDSGAALRAAASPPAPGRLVDAATSGGPSKRLAVTIAVLVVTSGTLTLVSAIPAAAILGDQEESTYTVDVGEVRLGDDGRICAASVGSNTYRVTITNATLVDATIYQQRDDGTVKTDFPSVQVDDTMVMYTRSDDEQFELLATTVGCTDEDQTSRTVFRNSYQTSEVLRSSDGVTMLNMEATDATVPEPGGFQFAAPGEDNESSTAPNVTNVTGVADGIDDVVNASLVDRLTNGSDDIDPVGDAVGDVDETVENVTGVETNATGDVVSSAEESVDNTTGEVTETDPPENVSGAVDDTTDTVDNTTGEVTGTVNDTTDAVDETVNETGDAADAGDEVTETVDDTTDTVDETTGTVEDTTDEVTDTVDDTTSTVEETTDEVGDTTGTVDDTTGTVEETTGTVEETTDDTTDTVDDTTDTVDDTTNTVEETTSTTTATPDDENYPDWLDQVDDEEAVLETIEETPGDIADVEDVTTETEPLPDETIEADENLTRLDNGTVLLLNGTDPADIEWASDLLEEPDATSVGTETVTSTPDTEESESDSDDGGLLSVAVV